MKKPRRKIDAALKATIASEARFVVSKTFLFETPSTYPSYRIVIRLNVMVLLSIELARPCRHKTRPA
jgi:hypothetical protein